VQAPVLVNGVGRRFHEQPYTGAGWEQPLRRRGRLRPVALRPEVDLGRVDLDEADALPVAERNRVPISDVVDHVDARPLRRICSLTRTSQNAVSVQHSGYESSSE
jgi:hypothetical protein